MVYILLAAAVLLVFLVWGFNSFARMRNVVRNAWADIDVQLKRRSDLVPNLVETTKGYSGFERTVLEEVTAARTKAADSALAPPARASADAALAGRIAQITAVAESYPELKASAQYIRLQDELSHTENQLASARQYYNAAVRDLNTMLETFPLGVLGRSFGFTKAEFFSVDDAHEREAPSAEMKP